MVHYNTVLYMDRVKRIWYLSPMRAAKVQASLRIRAVSPEPPLLAYTSSESRGTFRQKARSLAPLNGWACTVKICHDGMLEDTNSLDGAHIYVAQCWTPTRLPRFFFPPFLTYTCFSHYDMVWIANTDLNLDPKVVLWRGSDVLDWSWFYFHMYAKV